MNHKSEDYIKQKIHKYLTDNGWEVDVAYGKKGGIDILAKKEALRWVIEVKGCGSRPPMRNNYFLTVLGETLQRMDCNETRYSIAFPDMEKFRRLWNELPNLAKERTKIDCIFVSDDKLEIPI
jgi:hypothetical protein